MFTITLNIEESLRDRIAGLAAALNQTPHAFMVEALTQKADEAEWLLDVQREAQERDVALQAGKPGVAWHEMKTYLRARVALDPGSSPG